MTPNGKKCSCGSTKNIKQVEGVPVCRKCRKAAKK